MRISDWSSDVCSSDLFGFPNPPDAGIPALPVGTIAMAVTAEQLEGSRFLRVRDDRDPAFQGSASVQGNIGTQKSLMAGEYLFLGGRQDILDRKSTRLNSSHSCDPRMQSSACKKQTH